MSSPARHNLTLYRGAAFSVPFLYEDPAGNPIDLTGYTAEFSAKPALFSTVETFNLTAAPDLEMDHDSGIITVTIGATETAAIQTDELVYTLKLISTTDDDDVIPLLFGKIIVSNEVF